MPATDTPTPPLIPDPDRLRVRLAELAREQSMLRRLLRAVLRGQSSGTRPRPDREGASHA
jgi:hypothetical protein